MTVIQLIACPDCGTPVHPERMIAHRHVAHGEPIRSEVRDQPIRPDAKACPECGKVCANAAGLGAHRRNTHKVRGTSKDKPPTSPVARTPSATSAWDALLLTVQGEPSGWHHQAACRDASVDPAWFWPTRGEDVNRAKDVCADCPVRERCLEEGLSRTFGDHGIWGGTTERERRRIRSTRRKAAQA